MMMGLFLLGSLHAQTGQSALTGVVSDSSGAIISGVNVSVLNTATGVARRTVTDGSGLFSIQSLNPGEYTVTVSGKGFQTSVTTGVVLSAGQTASLSPVLQFGKETVTVTVTTDSALLNKDSSDVITTVNHTIVENLPYPEQSSLEATLLVPGVNGDPLQPGGISTENPGAFTGYVTPGASISIGGGGPGVNAILVDGSDVIQGSYARAGVNLSGLVVGETSVITAGMSAKYGRNGGGVIIQASRPGTNEYHGAVSWRHTDPGFNAFPLGSTARSALHQNFYGFYVGGACLDSEDLRRPLPHLLLCRLRARSPLQPVHQPRNLLDARRTRRQPQQLSRRHRPSQSQSERRGSRACRVSPHDKMHEWPAYGKRRLLSVKRQRPGLSLRTLLHQLRTIPSGDRPSGRLWPGMDGCKSFSHRLP